MRKLLGAAALGLVMVAGGAMAKETVVWWDFLGGGDGVRMKKLIEDFNAANKDTVEIQATTLDWGTPFYSKVQTSTAVGEGPDVMTYHASRLPLGVDQGSIAEITADDMAAMGLSQDSFAPATWDAVQVDGKQYAVPFDTHPIVLYYNKDLLEKSGLIGADGLPSGLTGLDNFNAALAKLKADGNEWPIVQVTADGGFAFRTVYSLLCQQGGQIGNDGDWFPGDSVDKLGTAINVISTWVKEGWNPAKTDYPTTVALFTSGKAPFMINGVWEVPTMDDLQKQGKLFNWGAIEIPALFDKTCTYSDSHTFAIPANAGKEVSPEKHAAVLQVIKFMADNSLFWATAGHVPANKAVTETPEYKAMQPQATYQPLTANAVFDPKSVNAGVASPLFDTAGNAITPAMNGELDPMDAAKQIQEELNAM